MYPLEGHRLLDAWDRASALSQMERAPQLLSIACPPTTTEQWRATGIAELNLQLLRLRQLTFGPNLAGYLPCPACGTRLEFGLDVGLAIEHLQSLVAGGTADFSMAGRDFSMRRLSTDDLLSIRGEPDAQRARVMLLGRCLSTSGDALDFDFSQASAESETTAMDVFSRLNEAAEMICQAQCVACGRAHRFDLDIARFIWSEVRQRALQLMRDVDELASAYGWSEEAILAMSPQRRRQYVEMVRT